MRDARTPPIRRPRLSAVQAWHPHMQTQRQPSCKHEQPRRTVMAGDTPRRCDTQVIVNGEGRRVDDSVARMTIPRGERLLLVLMTCGSPQ
jgi:hypothetical protein